MQPYNSDSLQKCHTSQALSGLRGGCCNGDNVANDARRSDSTEIEVVHHHEHHGKQVPLDPNAPKGYAALNGARDMLNEMMDDAMAKLDNEVETCTTYNRETLALIEH